MFIDKINKQLAPYQWLDTMNECEVAETEDFKFNKFITKL